MNFLGHLYVSPLNNDFLTGSFIADAVKGKAIFALPDGVRLGVEAHRHLDQFTDHHPAFKAMIALLAPEHARWSGIIADILMDHFLAVNWEKFATLQLPLFASHCYSVISLNQAILPLRTTKILPLMMTENWLVNYARFDFLDRVFTGMHKRTLSRSTMLNATRSLQIHYNDLSRCFNDFMPQAASYGRQLCFELAPTLSNSYEHQIMN